MISAFLLAALFSINTLPDVTHIDGEVSTNIVLNISSKLSEFSLNLSLEATPSNTLEVTFAEYGPLFKRSWTHLKITSRGDDQSFGALEVKQSDGWFYVVIR